jgi:Arc/MetJ-type ribon-helix-helix transcriptional regulator
MKPVNEASSKPTTQEIEKSVESTAELQALILQGLESGDAKLFDKTAFLSRMKTRNGEGS